MVPQAVGSFQQGSARRQHPIGEDKLLNLAAVGPGFPKSDAQYGREMSECKIQLNKKELDFFVALFRPILMLAVQQYMDFFRRNQLFPRFRRHWFLRANIRCHLGGKN